METHITLSSRFVLLLALAASACSTESEQGPATELDAVNADEIVYGVSRKLTREGVQEALLFADSMFMWRGFRPCEGSRPHADRLRRTGAAARQHRSRRRPTEQGRQRTHRARQRNPEDSRDRAGDPHRGAQLRPRRGPHLVGPACHHARSGLCGRGGPVPGRLVVRRRQDLGHEGRGMRGAMKRAAPAVSRVAVGVGLMAVFLVPAPAVAQGGTCELVKVGGYTYRTRFDSLSFVHHASGGIDYRCTDGMRLLADSAVVFESNEQVHLFGRVHLVDADTELDADSRPVLRRAQAVERVGRM